jgi:hypothetical protein
LSRLRRLALNAAAASAACFAATFSMEPCEPGG